MIQTEVECTFSALWCSLQTYYKAWSTCCIGFIGCMGGAEKLLLAKVKNASGRIGIFLFSNHLNSLLYLIKLTDALH